MDLILNLFFEPSVAHDVFILSIVIALGLALGGIRIGGVSLGVTGVLFAGLFFGHFNLTIDPQVLGFIRDFGLILFIYTIGVQVGPGFFSAFKRDGLSLNLMAASIVLGGVVITLLAGYLGYISFPAVVGVLSGAATNTPSLGAAQQLIKEMPNFADSFGKMLGLGYAVTYPFGILGVILTMILLKLIFRIDPKKEAREYEKSEQKRKFQLDSVNLRVENINLNNLSVEKIPSLEELGIVISRIMHEGEVGVAAPGTKIYAGDIIHAVGKKENLEKFQIIVGSKSSMDLKTIKSDITSQRLIVTKERVVGKTIEELDAVNRHGITITRVIRSEIEFLAAPSVKLNFADRLLVVGEEESIKKFAAEIGNSMEHLDYPFIIPIFVGIALGIILGSCPIYFPGMPAAVKLGLAGGPLVVAIFLSWLGRVGGLIWYMPSAANYMLREIGITLFLATVGLRSGDQFMEIILQGDGLRWMALGALITTVPILAAGIFARLKLKMNYLTICGLLAGSMTDPPALAFANSVTQSSAVSVAYAAVYPLVMLLRIISAQILVLLLGFSA